MKYLIIIIIVLSSVGCAPHARRSILGNWEEAPDAALNVIDSQSGNIVGRMHLKQYQKYWADELDAANLELKFVNLTQKTISFNFQVRFSLNTPPRRYLNHRTRAQERYNGYWTYTNAVARVAPNETFNFGNISDRIVSITDGTFQVVMTSHVTYEGVQ